MSNVRDIAVKYAHLLSAPDYSMLLNEADRIAELEDVLNKLDLLACKADDANMVRLIRAVTENKDE